MAFVIKFTVFPNVSAMLITEQSEKDISHTFSCMLSSHPLSRDSALHTGLSRRHSPVFFALYSLLFASLQRAVLKTAFCYWRRMLRA